MITWDEICPALIAIFTEIAADDSIPDDGFIAEWKEGPRTATSDKQRASVLLKITTCVGLGSDETREEYVDPSSTDPDDAPFLGQLRSVQVGQRKFTLQVQVLVPEHTDDMWAMAVTERMRTRIWRDRILDKLEDVNVAIIDIKQAVKLPPTKDRGRVVSIASMDFILATSVNDVDTVPTGWIERIELDSHIQDTDGTELPVPPNVVGHAIPPYP